MEIGSTSGDDDDASFLLFFKARAYIYIVCLIGMNWMQREEEKMRPSAAKSQKNDVFSRKSGAVLNLLKILNCILNI